MGCVRETPHIKNEASTGYVTETLQVEYFYLFLKRRKKKLKGKKATTKKEKKRQHWKCKRNSLRKSQDSTGV